MPEGPYSYKAPPTGSSEASEIVSLLEVTETHAFLDRRSVQRVGDPINLEKGRAGCDPQRADYGTLGGDRGEALIDAHHQNPKGLLVKVVERVGYAVPVAETTKQSLG